MHKIVVNLLALALVTPCLSAGPLYDATVAYDAKDYAKAIAMWRPLAEQGDASAQYSLGLMYDNGLGVTQNYTYAHQWNNLAESQGNAKAVTNRDRVAQKMTRTQLSQAQRLASEWQPSVAK